MFFFANRVTAELYPLQHTSLFYLYNSAFEPSIAGNITVACSLSPVSKKLSFLILLLSVLQNVLPSMDFATDRSSVERDVANTEKAREQD